MTKLCVQCGKENRDIADFCRNCGEKLDESKSVNPYLKDSTIVESQNEIEDSSSKEIFYQKIDENKVEDISDNEELESTDEISDIEVVDEGVLDSGELKVSDEGPDVEADVEVVLDSELDVFDESSDVEGDEEAILDSGELEKLDESLEVQSDELSIIDSEVDVSDEVWMLRGMKRLLWLLKRRRNLI